MTETDRCECNARSERECEFCAHRRQWGASAELPDPEGAELPGAAAFIVHRAMCEPTLEWSEGDGWRSEALYTADQMRAALAAQPGITPESGTSGPAQASAITLQSAQREDVSPLADGFDGWWAAHRIKRVLNPVGVARMVWEASARHNRKTVLGATDSTSGFYPEDEGSIPSGQATPIPAEAPEIGEVTWQQAADAIENLDDYARMMVGVDPSGPRETLYRFLEQAKAALASKVQPKGTLTASPDLDAIRKSLDQFERQAHRMGELWERCQGKGWPEAEDRIFTRLRDESQPATRRELLALIGIPVQAPAVAPEDAKDAARYRWLRDKSEPPHNFYVSVPVEFHGVRYQPGDVDAYIDAAMASRPPVQGSQS